MGFAVECITNCPEVDEHSGAIFFKKNCIRPDVSVMNSLFMDVL